MKFCDGLISPPSTTCQRVSEATRRRVTKWMFAKDAIASSGQGPTGLGLDKRGLQEIRTNEGEGNGRLACA